MIPERPRYADVTPEPDYPDPWKEEPIELRRFLDALRESRYLIIGILAIVTIGVLLISLVLPQSYRATAKVVLASEAASESGDSDFLTRELSTMRALLTTPEVLRSAANRLPGETKETLEEKVHASVDPGANVMNVAATDSDADGAAEIANTVSSTFIDKHVAAERQRLRREHSDLLSELSRLRASGELGAQGTALRERLGQVIVMEARVGSNLQLAERAEPPSDPRSPHPIRNTVLAFLAAAVIAVLVALGRQSLAPLVRGVSGASSRAPESGERRRAAATAANVGDRIQSTTSPPYRGAADRVEAADLASVNTAREQEVLEALTSLGRPVKVGELRAVLGYARSTILRDLDRLVEVSKVTRLGTGTRGDPYVYEAPRLGELPGDSPSSGPPRG
jgi:capsular polysaccharide biosynthesis protein